METTEKANFGHFESERGTERNADGPFARITVTFKGLTSVLLRNQWIVLVLG